MFLGRRGIKDFCFMINNLCWCLWYNLFDLLSGFQLGAEFEHRYREAISIRIPNYCLAHFYENFVNSLILSCLYTLSQWFASVILLSQICIEFYYYVPYTFWSESNKHTRKCTFRSANLMVKKAISWKFKLMSDLLFRFWNEPSLAPSV